MGVKSPWIKPGVDLARYDKLMVDPVRFELAADAKAIDAEKMKEMSDLFTQEFIGRLQDRVLIVTEPGPGVARVQVVVTDLEPNQQVLTVVPETPLHPRGPARGAASVDDQRRQGEGCVPGVR